MILTPNLAVGKLSIFIEPYLGYSQMSLDYIAEEDSYAVVLGGKGGLDLGKGVLLGLDYHTGGPYQFEFPENDFDYEFNTAMFGAGLGIYTKKIRAWVGYYPRNELEEYNLFAKFAGTSIKLGLGFEFKSKLLLSINFIKHSYNKVVLTTSSTPFSYDVASEVIFATISAPLRFK